MVDLTEELCQQLTISSEADIIKARRLARDFAKDLGFGLTNVTRIVTAVSELARNIVRYAGHGEIRYRIIEVNGKRAIEVVFDDQGPGIVDVDLAMSEGYSTSNSLGLGLPGAKRLMDSMKIDSTPGKGTKVVVIKWV